MVFSLSKASILLHKTGSHFQRAIFARSFLVLVHDSFLQSRLDYHSAFPPLAPRLPGIRAIFKYASVCLDRSMACQRSQMRKNTFKDSIGPKNHIDTNKIGRIQIAPHSLVEPSAVFNPPALCGCLTTVPAGWLEASPCSAHPTRSTTGPRPVGRGRWPVRRQVGRPPTREVISFGAKYAKDLLGEQVWSMSIPPAEVRYQNRS